MLTARRASVLGLLALPFVGRGWLNGDAAAYFAQGARGDLTDRWTHVGYVAIAWVLAPLGPVGLDLLGVAAGVAAALAVARLTDGEPRSWVAVVGTVAVLLPWAPFAEVDPLWMAAVAASAAGLNGAAALAVCVSPIALLALPWASVQRRGPAPLAEGLAAVAVLTVLSGGAWWLGERGVLVSGPLLPGRTAGLWATSTPWALAALLLVEPRRAWPLLALVPLLLAPPDVPGWAMGGIGVAVAASRAKPCRWVPLAVAVQLGAGVAEVGLRARRVAAEDRVVQHVAAHLGPGDGLVAPWTWGARVAVAASGDPYGVPWHPPAGWLRGQEEAWVGIERMVWLPPGEGEGAPDEVGVRWSR